MTESQKLGQILEKLGSLEDGQGKLDTAITDLNAKLFDHEKGLAIQVHDNTKLRKKMDEDKLIKKIYTSINTDKDLGDNNTIDKANTASKFVKDFEKNKTLEKITDSSKFIKSVKKHLWFVETVILAGIIKEIFFN